MVPWRLRGRVRLDSRHGHRPWDASAWAGATTRRGRDDRARPAERRRRRVHAGPVHEHGDIVRQRVRGRHGRHRRQSGQRAHHVQLDAAGRFDHGDADGLEHRRFDASLRDDDRRHQPRCQGTARPDDARHPDQPPSRPATTSRRPAARDATGGPMAAWRILGGDGPDPDSRAARAPGAGAHVRGRRAAAARSGIRTARRARPARLGRTRSGGPRSRPGCTAARSRRRSAGRAGRSSSRSSSTSSSASRPAACGRTSRVPTTSWSMPTPTSVAATSSRACAASARGAMPSPRTGPAPTRGPCAPPRSATPPPGSTCSTARSGS